VHFIDEGVDTGDIIAQRAVSFSDPGETLASTYAALNREAVALFTDVWPVVAAGRPARRRQPPGGSVHRLRDKEPYTPLLTRGWDTPVSELVGRALPGAGTSR
jgi:methionyl-tRNA formyltransferase